MEIRQCGSCGAMTMTHATRDLSEQYKGETITIAAMPGWYCDACGESEFLTSEDADRFSRETKAAMEHIDAQLAAFVRATRKRLGLNQSEAAALFGGGINAFSEYERGIRKPSKATLLLLKILGQHPELLKEIKAA